VSTVIDRKFVENTPLNGRSFQSLILLTPGAVTTSPQRTSTAAGGDTSINGQRTESNYYTVDGVSAVSGISSAPTAAGASGSLPAYTALGTTQALVSVDALQEFRVESSTYSAEYGRNPGGQISMVTRSGTNDWHGTAFDYFRNEALDANSWFNDNTVPITRKPPERQNDFGGTLGGPIRIPYFYNGRNRSFFFFSYEGLRLSQPTAAGIDVVPNLALRQSATGPLQQALNAFPLPTPGAPDLGNGLGEFIGSWTNPSHINTSSIRLDHNLGQRTHLFFRFSDAPSDADTRGTGGTESPSTVVSSMYLARTYTLGATVNIAHNVNNDFRLNFSSNNFSSHNAEDNFGGAVPIDLNNLQALPSTAESELLLQFPGYLTSLVDGSPTGKQRQWNLVDIANIEQGSHTFKMGVDWRRLTPTIQPANPFVEAIFQSATSVSSSSIDTGIAQSSLPDYPVYTNVSLFIQDEWRIKPRLSVSTGIRWDINPAPGVSQGSMPYTVTGLDKPSTMTLAPQGTPLWNTSWFNFAPRLGAAYILNTDAEKQTVIRGGGGLFFDTGQQTGSYAFQGPGFSAQSVFGKTQGKPTTFPAPIALNVPTISQPPTTPYGIVYVNPVHLQLPYTFHWNLSLEQGLGRSQSVTISYVGANGRKLLEQYSMNAGKVNPKFTTLNIYKNGLTSSYNALQVKYQRQVSRGIQALVSYTWSHSLDSGSYNGIYPYRRGNSDFDVRNNVAAALSYDLPSSSHLGWLTPNWGVDGRFTARSGFPIAFNGSSYTDPNTFQTFYGGLNLVPNNPLYLYGSHSTYPGGRRINPAAFALPTTG
jgi:TonB dependent receptor